MGAEVLFVTPEGNITILHPQMTQNNLCLCSPVNVHDLYTCIYVHIYLSVYRCMYRV